MFREWGFLLTEIWFLVILAGLVGLIAGWLIWGGRAAAAAGSTSTQSGTTTQQTEAHKAEMKNLASKLERCRADGARKDDRIKEIEAELDELRGRAAFTAPIDAFVPDDPDDDTLHRYDQDAGQDEDTDAADEAEAEPTPEAETPPEDTPTEDIGTRPASLDAPRDGTPDDLKKIKGVGPKMEKLVNSLGFYHFDQIAAWSEDEIAWVDANLEGFKGRVTRDDWVAQAKDLAGSS